MISPSFFFVSIVFFAFTNINFFALLLCFN